MPTFRNINLESIMKSLVIGATVIGIAYVFPHISNGIKSSRENSEYETRKEQVIEYISTGKLDSAEKILEEYSGKSILRDADSIELKIKIEDARKNPVPIPTPVAETKLEEKVAEVSSQYNTQDNKTHQEVTPEKKVNAFLLLSLEESLQKFESDFLFGEDEDIVLIHTADFYKHIQEDEFYAEIPKTDFSHLENSWRDYVSLREGSHSINTETTVVITGKAGESDKDGNRKYKYKETPLRIPLLIKGEFIRKSNFDDGYSLIEINDDGVEKVYWFDASEFEFTKTKEKYLQASKSPFLEIKKYMDGIESYYGAVKKLYQGNREIPAENLTEVQK